MAIFLIIDTALEEAIVALSKDGKIIDELKNNEAHSHASFIQVAIANLFERQQMSMHVIDAVVVTLGPGSYTGLRVGLASAKGIAYTLQKPLIGLSTLSALAQAAIKSAPATMPTPFQIFSMIDARRMEVFGAIFNADLSPKLPEQAIVLDANKWEQFITGPTICIGNGSGKTKEFTTPHPVYYEANSYTSQSLLEMATTKFQAGEFEDLAYIGPNYLKEVYILPSK